MRISFKLEATIAADLQRFHTVNWDAVVADAVRTKLKVLRQGRPVPAVNRDAPPWLAEVAVTEPIPSKPRAPKPARSKWPKVERRGRRPVQPAEVVAQRRELLRSM